MRSEAAELKELLEGIVQEQSQNDGDAAADDGTGLDENANDDKANAVPSKDGEYETVD